MTADQKFFVSAAGDVRLIAFYLPQFHPIPENDEWWGKGFTEWTNTVQGRPYFDGHYQPHIPGELGFYDLRVSESREAQAELARAHGIYGFCYHYYWFGGRRLLERPLNEVVASGKPDFPFCICWSNENWTRRWDGSEHQVLMNQVHDEDTDAAFINDIIPLFKDIRYIRLNGAPLLIIYRLSLLPNPRKTATLWREICAQNGIPEVHLCMVEFAPEEPSPYTFGFDSSAQFPPHGVFAPAENPNVTSLDDGFTGHLYDMKEVVSAQLSRPRPLYKRFPGVMPSWDNTARRKKAGAVFINSSPQNYQTWLSGAIDQAKEELPPGQRLVFINAWNEWAEGAHLEPDLRHGRAYLEATKRALDGAEDWREIAVYARTMPQLAGNTKLGIIDSLSSRLERLEATNKHMASRLNALLLSTPNYTEALIGQPSEIAGMSSCSDGILGVDQVNWHRFPNVPQTVHLYRRQYMVISGWCVSPTAPSLRDTISYLMFIPSDTEAEYFCVIPGRIERSDLVGFMADRMGPENSLFSGFSACVDISCLTPGRYTMRLATQYNGIAYTNDVGITMWVD